MDVTKYGDNLALFQFAFKEFGRVDHAISIAGVVEQGNILDPNLTIESVQEVRSRLNLRCGELCRKTWR